MCCGWHFLYSAKPPLYTFVVSRAFMAGAASQAGDADSSRAPGLTSGLQGSVNVHRGALLLVPQLQCISSFVFYIRTNNIWKDFAFVRRKTHACERYYVPQSLKCTFSSYYGVQALTKEFSSGGGGPTFNKQKKNYYNNNKREEGGRFSIYSALVWSKPNFAIETASRTITFNWYDLLTQTHLTWLF